MFIFFCCFCRGQNHGEPLRKRYRESQERPHFLEEYGRSLQQIKKAIDLYLKGDERYAHLEKTDIDRAMKCVDEKQRWFEDKSNVISKMRLTEDPVVLSSQIKDEKEVNTFVNFILHYNCFN